MVSLFQSKNRNKFWAKSFVLPKWIDKAHLRRPQERDRNTQQITSTLFSQFHRHVSGSAGAKFQFREYSFIVSEFRWEVCGCFFRLHHYQPLHVYSATLHCVERHWHSFSVFFSGTTKQPATPQIHPSYFVTEIHAKRIILTQNEWNVIQMRLFSVFL